MSECEPRGATDPVALGFEYSTFFVGSTDAWYTAARIVLTLLTRLSAGMGRRHPLACASCAESRDGVPVRKSCRAALIDYSHTD